MVNYLDEENENCTTKIDLAEARKVADFLGLPFFTFDYRDEYESRIIDYIYREYEAGRTPNPDVFCNNLVKFDLFLEEALSLGYDKIATGHYAQIENNQKGARPKQGSIIFFIPTLRISDFQSHFPYWTSGKIRSAKYCQKS